MLDNLNIERPYFGYFCEVKVHHTDRPRPEGIKKPEYNGNRSVQTNKITSMDLQFGIFIYSFQMRQHLSLMIYPLLLLNLASVRTFSISVQLFNEKNL